MKNEFNQDHVVPEGSLHFKESRVHRPCLTKDNCDNNLRQNNDNNNTVFIEGTTRSLKIPLTSKENLNFRRTSFFHISIKYPHERGIASNMFAQARAAKPQTQFVSRSLHLHHSTTKLIGPLQSDLSLSNLEQHIGMEGGPRLKKHNQPNALSTLTQSTT